MFDKCPYDTRTFGLFFQRTVENQLRRCVTFKASRWLTHQLRGAQSKSSRSRQRVSADAAVLLKKRSAKSDFKRAVKWGSKEDSYFWF